MSRAEDIALAHRLADAAGDVIRPHFRSGVGIEIKPDASPVTIADRAAETAMRAIVEGERPGDGIIGEEFGDHQPGSRRTWVFDPIDGTRSFIAGRPIFGTLVALMEDGVPVLGVIDQCIARERWIGADGETRLNGVRVATRACPLLGDAHLATTAPHLFDAAGATGFARLRAAARDTLYGGDCHNYALLAAGCLDVVVESGLKLYDWAALVPVVTGAGGAMTDWVGAPLRQGSDGRVIAAANAGLIEQVRARL
jgi:histidinol phosphatase-like enzyme (inositol monophosphatase family)